MSELQQAQKPAFNAATWQETVDQAGGLENMVKKLRAQFTDPAERAQAYMNLSIVQIEQLPQDEQKLIWNILSKQIIESTNIAASFAVLSELNKALRQAWGKTGDDSDALKTAHENADTIWRQITAAAENWPKVRELWLDRHSIMLAAACGSDLSQIKVELAGMFLALAGKGIEDALQLWPVMIPYINAEHDSNPDLYDSANTPTSALIAAAARRARDAGKKIPLLWAEQAQVKQLGKMPPLHPRAHIMPNNALMNVIQQTGVINAGELALPVIPARGGQKEITAYTIVDYEADEAGGTGITITDPKLTEYERNVSNAIVSLWVEAEKLGVEPVFTTDTIYRAMPGGGETASPQQKGAITKTFEKLRRIHMTIDATDELRKRGAIKGSETFKLDEYYFNVRRAKRTSKHSGQSVTAYQLLGKPVILQYSEMTGQILSVPAKHLTIKKIDKHGGISTELVTMNADRQAITGYMMRRIAVMKHDLEAARDRQRSYERKRKKHPEQELPEKPLAAFRQQSNTILFETLFAATDTTTDNAVQAKRNRDFCFDVLEYWKATGFIKGHSMQSKGRKITGIAIEI